MFILQLCVFSGPGMFRPANMCEFGLALCTFLPSPAGSVINRDLASVCDGVAIRVSRSHLVNMESEVA
jgi:hypothetical protein